jgi:hypothetical protein
MTVTIAMPVVKVKARTIATNIFFIDDDPPCSAGYRNDIMLKISILLLGENT